MSSIFTAIPSISITTTITILTLLLVIRPRSSLSPSVSRARDHLVPPPSERVVILGASSGVGRALAERYARRGARICIVARRKEELEVVKQRCLELMPAAARAALAADQRKEDTILVVAGDISNVDDMMTIRQTVMDAWSGIDTVHIISGLPSTQTLMSIAETSGSVDKDGLQRVVDEVTRCSSVNITGVGLSIATFLDILATTSPSPLIHHLSSLAAVIPAPTRSLYSATKSGGLALFRTAAWEQPSNNEGRKSVRFLAILPGTIDTAFRRKSTSASRGFPPSEEFEKRTLSVDQTVDSIIHHSSLPPSTALTIPIPFLPLCIRVPFLRVPTNDVVFLPEWPYRLAFWALDTWAVGFVRNGARRKYGLE